MLKIMFSVMLVAAAALPLAAEVRLASGGKTDHTVVLAVEKPGADEKAAEEDLCKYLSQITGAKFTVNGDAPHKIYIGKKAPNDNVPLAPFERRVRCENGDVYLYGNGYKGNAFAVYDFLEKFFNCRWYTLYGDEYIPERREAVFADLTLNVIPSFDTFSYNGNEYIRQSAAGNAFRRRARIYDYRPGGEIAEDVLTGGHIFCKIIPAGTELNPPPKRRPLKYFKDKKYFLTNPEFFSITKSGKRASYYQLCFSNPELRKEFIRNYEIIIANEYKGGPARMSLHLNDKGHWGDKCCYCPECEKLNEKYGSPVGSYWDFVLDICRYFKEKHPDIRLTASAYAMTDYPPARGFDRTPDNLILFIAPLDMSDFLRSYRETPGVYENISAWGKVARGRFGIQLYPTVYCRPLFTYPLVANIDRLVRNLRDAHRIGINELVAEFGCGPATPVGFNELRMYLFSCLARDVNADVPALIKDFMEHYYGEAAPMMMKYLDELEACERNEKNVLRWWPDHRSALSYLTPANLLKWQKEFDEMEKLTDSDAKANLHVRRARTNLDEATMSVWYKFKPGEMPDRDMMYARYKKTLRDSARDRVADVKPARDRKRFMAQQICSNERAMYYHYALAGKWRPLPEKFAKLPEGCVKRAVPHINREELTRGVEGSAAGIAVDGSIPKGGADFHLFRWDGIKEISEKFEPKLSLRKVKRGTGKYDYYYIGTTRLYPDSMISTNCLRRASGVMTGFLFDPANPEQRYDIYLSLKPEGKKLRFDEMLLVKSNKPSTLEAKEPARGKGAVKKPSKLAPEGEDPTGNL